MTDLQMPFARDFRWKLKPTSTSHFDILQRSNGQFCVVLNHALLRGCRAEMLHWWFRNFANLRVRLEDVPGYEGKEVPAYLLWHPIDHFNAALGGRLASDGSAQAGATIHIQEAMQYDTYGWKYPVDTTLNIFYVGDDGWAMGRTMPFFGPVMMLRIHFRDVEENGTVIGVHYHYEVVIGVSAPNPVGRFINARISSHFGPEFFEAWHRHNVIEVGVFENFLPPLFDQRSDPSNLVYHRDMDPKPADPAQQFGQSKSLFDERVAGYRTATKPHAYQGFDKPTFL